MNRLIKIVTVIRIVTVMTIILFFIERSPLIAEIIVPLDYQTIQEAIDASVNGTRIIVQPGIYFEHIDFSGKGIILESSDPNDPQVVAETIIDGNSAYTVVTFTHNESKSSVLNGFTIKNGKGSNGGGIFCMNASPTIMNCALLENDATVNGGGIFCQSSSSPEIINCIVRDNKSSNYGGGMACDNSSPLLNGCEISQNSAKWGGGIDTLNSSPTIIECTIHNNNADYGGGIDCYTSSPNIRKCTIQSNMAYNGGGINCHAKSAPTIRDCIIKGNTVNENGKGNGIACYLSSPNIINCILIDNGSGDSSNSINARNSINAIAAITDANTTLGGAIHCNSSNPYLAHCTITHNSSFKGGGIYCENSSPIITNCILWKNSPDELYAKNLSPGSFLNKVTYSCIKGGYAGVGNIDSDPLFIAPESGNVYLDQRSPCIDKGDPTCGITEDIDGVSRPQDGDDDRIAIVDMGAYEFVILIHYQDADGDGFGDPNTILSDCTLPHRCAANRADCNDQDAFINPGMADIPYDGIDQDCNGTDITDIDEDGYDSVNAAGGNDCDDNDLSTYPDAPERCDGKDSDCDGIVPEVEYDADNDGFIQCHDCTPPLSDNIKGCNDCNASDPNINPLSQELLNGRDDNCNGIIDEGFRQYNVPDDYATIQDAINAAYDGDIVMVTPGTYYENINFLHKAITVKGLALDDQGRIDPNKTIIHGNGSEPVAAFDHGEGNASLLDGFTLMSGGGDYGGGIYCFGASPRISHCIIKENSAIESGGGIFCDTNSSPHISACTIMNNVASDGGGIYCSSYSSPHLSHTLINNNSAGNGGGIRCFYFSSPVIVNCNVFDNSAGMGGGIYCSDSSSPLIKESTIDKNRALFIGGGISGIEFSSLTLINSLICNNFTTMIGGSGGGIDCARSILTMNNCTISNNATYSGGGIFLKDSSAATISSSILWGNSPDQLLCHSTDTNDVIITYSCLSEPLITSPKSEKNIYANPLFINPGAGDFHLDANSPCIDSGDPHSILYIDKDGILRPQDGNGDGITRGDMGIYEFPRNPAMEIPLEQGWNLISFQCNKVFYQKTKPAVFIPDGVIEVSLGSNPQYTLKEWLSDDANSPIRDSNDRNQAGDWQRITSFDSTGAHILDKNLPSFINTLHYLCVGYGYWIKMNKAGALVLSGQFASDTIHLSLRNGWNLIGYIPHTLSFGDISQESVCPYANGHYNEEDIAYCHVTSPVANRLFQGIIGKYRRITSFDSCKGAMIYDTLLPPFINTLHYFGPHYGYWIKIENPEPLEFAFPDECK